MMKYYDTGDQSTLHIIPSKFHDSGFGYCLVQCDYRTERHICVRNMHPYVQIRSSRNPFQEEHFAETHRYLQLSEALTPNYDQCY